MSLRHIEAFRIVSVAGSMTEAASQMHTSQPQISRLIAQLEEITGFDLFHRNGSRLSPTSEGAHFYRDVEQTFRGLTALETAAARIRAFSTSRLSVSAMPRLAGGMLAQAVVRFKRAFPEAMVSIHSSDADTVHNWVNSGLCDVGLAMVYAEPHGVAWQRLCSLECVAIVPNGHPLANRSYIEAEDFDGEPFISLPSGSSLRARIDAIFEARGIAPLVVAEASLGSSVCALVSAGLGISLINPLAATEEGAGAGLIAKPFRPSIPVEIVLLFHEHHTQSRLVKCFSESAAEVISSELSALDGGRP